MYRYTVDAAPDLLHRLVTLVPPAVRAAVQLLHHSIWFTLSAPESAACFGDSTLNRPKCEYVIS